MARESKTQYAIMGLLNIGDMSGYDIKKMITHSLSFFWQESWGQIYPTLKKLEERGLVSVSESSEGRNKKIYSLSESGRRELQKYLIKTPDEDNMRNELLLKLFFGRGIGPDVIQSHLKHEKMYRELMMKEQENIILDQDNACIDPLDAKYWGYCLQFGKMYNEMISRWCDLILDDLGKGN